MLSLLWDCTILQVLPSICKIFVLFLCTKSACQNILRILAQLFMFGITVYLSIKTNTFFMMISVLFNIDQAKSKQRRNLGGQRVGIG
uniref:Uncharacterized protein n=1 Tax=Arundo donax TaxID=35708 RepID=A0A0A9B771_ARUDO